VAHIVVSAHPANGGGLGAAEGGSFEGGFGATSCESLERNIEVVLYLTNKIVRELLAVSLCSGAPCF